MTALEVLDKFLVLSGTHISCPDGFCVVDIRVVIHPLPIRVVLRFITNDHKMLAGSDLQLRQDACSIQIARQRVVPTPSRTGGYVEGECRGAEANHEKTDQRNR